MDLSTRLDEGLLTRLRTLSAYAGVTPAQLATRFIEEGVSDRHPGNIGRRIREADELTGVPATDQ